MKQEMGKGTTQMTNAIPDTCINILMVEDNPGDVLLVRELLRESRTNFNLSHASSLKETFKICAETNYDAILLDLGLPESYGLETLRKIKLGKINSPIVVMTGLDDEDVALSSLREGAQDYLVKNRLTSDNLLRAILYGIERKKIQDLLKKHTLQFSILSLATGEISRCEDISSIIKVTCHNIKLLIDKVNVISVEFDKNNSLQLGCQSWLEPWIDKIKELSGFDLRSPQFAMRTQRNELLEHFQGGNLHELSGGMYELLGGTVDKTICSEIEKITDIHEIYVFGFIREGDIYGGVLIFSPTPIGVDDINNVDTLVSHASISIRRQSIENDLRISELRYKDLNRELEHKVHDRTRDLKLTNVKLQRELKERIQAEEALKKSEKSLQELNDTKNTFFNIVAHDLKNPFTSLMGSSELLYMNIDGMDPEKIKMLALILNDSAKSGYAILQNILDWSRSQTGMLKFNPEHINLHELIDENISNLQLLASNKEIRLWSEADENISFVADKGMLDTILRNLLSNAVKFTHRSGSVVVKTSVEDDMIYISVIDSGVGISPEDVENLFKIDLKYSMPGTENEHGTGLGLKLTREFVEKHGGQIWVESVENKGSEFRFSVPYRKK